MLGVLSAQPVDPKVLAAWAAEHARWQAEVNVVRLDVVAAGLIAQAADCLQGDRLRHLMISIRGSCSVKLLLNSSVQLMSESNLMLFLFVWSTVVLCSAHQV